MSRLAEYSVIQPPSSGEVFTEYVNSLLGSGVLTLTLTPAFEVPREPEQVVSVQVFQAFHPQELDEGTILKGEVQGQAGWHSANIQLSPADNEPAKATFVRD
jgi:hypothetical protein